MILLYAASTIYHTLDISPKANEMLKKMDHMMIPVDKIRIVIGKGGEMLRKIGTDARKDIENMLQCQVNLKLWVKVRKEWRDSDSQLRNFGYDKREV